VCVFYSTVLHEETHSALDDDFDAFKALTKKSMHATVAVIIPRNGRSSWDPVVRDRIFRPDSPNYAV
jgi:hypothetical protein